MAGSSESANMALFCDFENVALGVRDAQYEKFDIKLVLERLLLKGSIVVKKAYCDWERYKGFKAAMHEASFELIEIPHVRQSGKNSADIRLVVDALDLCYTKSHVDTFVIISGDSDFSPLVSKLRENAKQVIGVGVKQSTSDLLIANCDEFIFYDDLVRERQRPDAPRDQRGTPSAPRRSPEEEQRRKAEMESRRAKAIALAVETFDALVAVRGDSGKMWASALKDAIKRQRPDFNESYYGFKAFGNLLEAAQEEGLLEVGRDEKSGTYVYRASADRHTQEVPKVAGKQRHKRPDAETAPDTPVADSAEVAPHAEAPVTRRGSRGGRKHTARELEPASLPAPAAPDTGAVSNAANAPADLASRADAPAKPLANPPEAQASPRAERPTAAPVAQPEPAVSVESVTAASAPPAAVKKTPRKRATAATKKSPARKAVKTATKAAASNDEPAT